MHGLFGIKPEQVTCFNENSLHPNPFVWIVHITCTLNLSHVMRDPSVQGFSVMDLRSELTAQATVKKSNGMDANPRRYLHPRVGIINADRSTTKHDPNAQNICRQKNKKKHLSRKTDWQTESDCIVELNNPANKSDPIDSLLTVYNAKIPIAGCQ